MEGQDSVGGIVLLSPLERARAQAVRAAECQDRAVQLEGGAPDAGLDVRRQLAERFGLGQPGARGGYAGSTGAARTSL